jgi:putative PIN family toxin of toxin-antitoxin system
LVTFRGIVLVSAASVDELRRVLSRPKFDRYLTAEEKAEFVASLVAVAEVVEVVSEVKACRDPDDNSLLSLALDGRATRIVTGDTDLLVLDPFESVRILTPQARFAELVN